MRVDSVRLFSSVTSSEGAKKAGKEDGVKVTTAAGKEDGDTMVEEEDDGELERVERVLRAGSLDEHAALIAYHYEAAGAEDSGAGSSHCAA